MYCEALEQCPQNDMNINNLLDLFELVGLVRNSCISILVGVMFCNLINFQRFSFWFRIMELNAHTHIQFTFILRLIFIVD